MYQRNSKGRLVKVGEAAIALNGKRSKIGVMINAWKRTNKVNRIRRTCSKAGVVTITTYDTKCEDCKFVKETLHAALPSEMVDIIEDYLDMGIPQIRWGRSWSGDHKVGYRYTAEYPIQHMMLCMDHMASTGHLNEVMVVHPTTECRMGDDFHNLHSREFTMEQAEVQLMKHGKCCPMDCDSLVVEHCQMVAYQPK